MFSSWNRLARCRSGVAAVEFAISMTFLTAMVFGLVDVGRALFQANAIEKGLRAGAMYVARATLPVDGTSETIQNLVKRGSIDPKTPYLVDGWSDKNAKVVVTKLSDYVNADSGISVPMYEVTASVPFSPIFPGVPKFTFTLSHQQAYIGR